MGLIDILSKALRREPTEVDREYTASTIRTSDELGGVHRANNPKDFTRVGRAIQGSIYNAATLVAKTAAAGELRLYKRAGAGKRSSKSRRIAARDVAFLRGRVAGIAPTAKAVSYANAAEDIEQVTEHPVLDLLRDPDPIMTYCDFMTMLFWYREVAGKAYVWTGGEKPVGLFLLHPQYTRAILSKTNGVEGYMYGRDQTVPMSIPAAEVIVSRYMPDPFAPWDGLSWVSSVEQYADVENAAIVSEVARWKNSGQYGIIIKAPKDYNDSQMKQLETSLRGKGGPLAAGRALIVRDMEVLEAGAKPHEMNYLEGLEQAERAIYRAAGIPEAVWKLNDANLASATVAEPIWQKNVYERQRRVAEDLTEWLLPMFGETPGDMWFSYDNPVRDDVELQTNRMSAAFVNGAVYLNEYRAALGLDPLADELNTLGKPIIPAGIVSPAETPEPETEAPIEEATIDEKPTEEAPIEEPTDDQIEETAKRYLRAMRVLRLKSEDGEEAPAMKADDIDRRPPKEAREEAERGLAWREEFNRGGTMVGVARARDIANGENLSEETILRMVSYFARHEVDKQGQGWNPGEEGYPSAGRIAWALWGGDAGRTFAESIAERIDAREEEKMCGEDHKSIGAKIKPPSELTDAELALLADRLKPYLAGDKELNEEEFTDAVAVTEPGEEVPSAQTPEGGSVDVAPEEMPIAEAPEGGSVDVAPEELDEEEGKPIVIVVDRFDWEGSAKCHCGEVHTKAEDEVESGKPMKKTEDKIREAVEKWAKEALLAGIASIRPDGTFDVSTLDPAALSSLMGASMNAAFEEGARAFIRNSGAVVDNPLSTNVAREYIQKYNFELVKGVTETMQNQLRTAIDKELAKGEAGEGTTINEVQQRLRDNVDEVSMNRAEVIARTETARAYAHGSMKQAEEIGYEYKFWSLGGNPCGLCQAAAAMYGPKNAIPITQPYFTPGSSIAGTDGKTYTIKRPIFAPSDVHPNCVCMNVEQMTKD
jgi:phage portal protein BeeE